MCSILYDGMQLPLGDESNIERGIALAIERWTGLQPSEYYCTQNGRRVSLTNVDAIRPDIPLRVCERLPGGKGGFGSMLRAIGAQIEKTTNREACRDLSGRRLRDINEEKRLKAYLEKQQEVAGEDERVKAERKIAKLLSKPKHEFEDKEYEHTRSELVVAADEAIQEGLQKALALELGQTVTGVEIAAQTEKIEASSSQAETRKRKHPATKVGIKPKKNTASLWLGADDLSSSSETDNDTTDEDNKDQQKALVAA
uniref:SDE2-like domain-containing protein n=1 Tax=Anopheles farauti TaxID=69004 RepID=A0A182QHS8_9DIPT